MNSNKLPIYFQGKHELPSFIIQYFPHSVNLLPFIQGPNSHVYLKRVLTPSSQVNKVLKILE